MGLEDSFKIFLTIQTVIKLDEEKDSDNQVGSRITLQGYRLRWKPYQSGLGPYKHYLGTYIMPLLEETRMEIYSQMKFMSGVLHAEVTSVEESKLHEGSFFYCIKVNSWRNQYGIYGKEPYIWVILYLKLLRSCSRLEAVGLWLQL
ncbi:hypothetical protein MKX03_024118 [Papaver bracteatum]|nr:hypothetical protein MKX03_024118 [Papaver bracteatum]